MANENDGNESFNPKMISNDNRISLYLLRSIVIGLLTLLCVFLVYTYFISGLTHKKAEEVFAEFWNKQNSSAYQKLEEVKILKIKKMETDNYLVSVFCSYWRDPSCEKKEEYRGQINKRFILLKYRQDCIISKRDTGWFVSMVMDGRNYPNYF